VGKITKEDLIAKLDYLGLDIDNVPEYLKDFAPISFNISRLNNDKDHRVFQFVPIDKIQILLTPTLRNDDIREKYEKAVPLGKYFNPDGTVEDIEHYKTLLEILNKLQIPDVENVANVQKELEKSEPFRVKYNKDHLWQIYYSQENDTYFMLVCTKEETFAEFFYLLKKKIAFAKNKRAKVVPKIFVPINYMNYSGDFLTRDEITDLENYLWLFTKNWPLIFEVYDKNNALSLQVVGDTCVYQNVKSTYKMKLVNPEEAIKFYKLLKALFIMQTEIKDHFAFVTKTDSKNGLELYMGKVRIDYENLADFIKSEYLIAAEEMKSQLENYTELQKDLKNLQKKSNTKEQEYLEKQKEISTYLECKKSFIGKVKFFFKGTKSVKSIKIKESVEDKISADKDLEEKQNNKFLSIDTYIKEKKYYTIEDLVTIYHVKEKNTRLIKNANQDIKALKLKIENLTSKVNNAKQYIDEIDKHRKSIFEFWKFANKDEKLALEVGNNLDKSNETSQIKKSFDFEMDFEKLGQEVDNIQRAKLSNEELDSIFIAKTNLLYILNMLRSNEMDKSALEVALYSLKEEFERNRLYTDAETFDIFGNVENDSRKVKYIGSRSHRENEKSKFKILNVNRKIDVFDFTEKLQSIVNYINGAMPKLTSKYDMPLYKVVPITEKIKEKCFDVFNINVENELANYQDNGEGALNLLKINFKEGMPLLYYSNITLFDNTSQTLPEGMDLSTNVLIDCQKFDFKLISKTKFRTNNYFNEKDNLVWPKSKDILVYEYDVQLKNNIKKEIEANENDKITDLEGHNTDANKNIKDDLEPENNIIEEVFNARKKRKNNT
jgi:DNA-binding protein YbaB